VIAIVGLLAGLVTAFVFREHSLGRFAPVDATRIDATWIERNILAYPAEVVGAAWDGRVGRSEVVALIARMTAEGKLESHVEAKNSMRLSLKVDRDSLNGHERALVDGLFFYQRKETSTKDVREHYKSSGFDPANVIRPELDKQVRKLLPAGDARVGRLAGLVLFATGIVLLLWTIYSDPIMAGAAIAVAIVSLILGAILQIPGWLFRSRIDWGPVAATLLMLPTLGVTLGTAAFVWSYFDSGEVEVPMAMAGALAAFALWISNASINGMKSRQNREATALRKRLATGRRFFLQELEEPQPNLHDSWYPWLLAFGLGRQVDVWSTHHSSTSNSSTWDRSTGHSSSNSSSTPTGWSGGGGLSGGAGASGAWAAAAAGMAAGVAAPGSSSSGSSGSSSSSSSGGSSGGGGGGGW
jgi:uncharacterized membrane protein YgcG